MIDRKYRSGDPLAYKKGYGAIEFISELGVRDYVVCCAGNAWKGREGSSSM